MDKQDGFLKGRIDPIQLGQEISAKSWNNRGFLMLLLS